MVSFARIRGRRRHRNDFHDPASGVVRAGESVLRIIRAGAALFLHRTWLG